MAGRRWDERWAERGEGTSGGVDQGEGTSGRREAGQGAGRAGARGLVAGWRRNKQRVERVEGTSNGQGERQSERCEGASSRQRGCEGTSGGREERQARGRTRYGKSGLRGQAAEGTISRTSGRYEAGRAAGARRNEQWVEQVEVG